MSKLGGKRPGAGRPVGSGKYGGEATQMMRVPVSRKKDVKEFLGSSYCLNVFDNFVRAGTLTSAGDEISSKVDVMDLVADNPSDSFVVRVDGESMIDARIFPDDLLVVDSKLEARDGSIVVASVDGECTVKRLKKTSDGLYLMPENEDFEPIPVVDENNFHIFGVVKKKISDVA